jgi:cytochrome c-type biogenesis protein CcmH
MRRLGRILVLACGLLAPFASLAVTPNEMLKDPALEARARALSAELRCMVCQNQSIDDSEAPLARDLRVLLRERIVAGDSDDDVIAFLVARYGDFILLRPPLRPYTVLLWAAPFAVLLAGAVAVVMVFRRQRRPLPTAPTLSPEEREKVAAMMDGDPKL